MFQLNNFNPKAKGLRVAIPGKIIDELGLKFEDLVEWSIIKKGDKMSACMSKLQ
jgi:hypothetical protein